ncbi:MAG: LLM class flavin-dependent oxidoreductase [Nocardioides sp.]
MAARTERIGLGTATLCAPFTAPAMLAKAMTTLDQLSAGRLTIGLGSAGCRRSTPPRGSPSHAGAPGWRSTPLPGDAVDTGPGTVPR